MEIRKILYTASATSQGGRRGHVRSSDGFLDFDLAMPEAMGGEGGSGTNPEQLYAAGYSACFGNALRRVAGHQGKDVSGAEITAHVGIGPVRIGGFGIEVELVGKMPNLSREEAESLMDQAHERCPYSRATRGNINVKLTIEE